MKMEMASFGRVAAQTAKQVIIQRVRDSEREKIHDAYKDRVSELITGIVRRFEKGAIIVDLGKTEAVIPSREQVHSESYRQGDRIQAYILEVARNARGPQIVLSRTHPGLLVKLFELEVLRSTRTSSLSKRLCASLVLGRRSRCRVATATSTRSALVSA